MKQKNVYFKKLSREKKRKQQKKQENREKNENVTS